MSVTGKPNILLIIADDLGADVVLTTDRSPQRNMYVKTDADGAMILGELSNLSTLLRNGLSFSQAWANPVCSPTRGSLFTGTWPWFNGIGDPGSPQLDPQEVTALPHLLAPEGYACGLFGKWHLGNRSGFRPPDHGWDLHVGTLGGRVNDYKSWDKETSADGYTSKTLTTSYLTRDTVDEAGAWINTVPVQTPWFATIAFHAPHDPFHKPPGGYQLPHGAEPLTREDEFNTMAQNMDFNIGRLLGATPGTNIDSIPTLQLENTVIIFLGDNGSHTTPAEEEVKMTIYEGGVRVPMIVADGRSVAAALSGTTAPPRFLAANKLNRSSPKMVHAIDLYETIAEIAGVTTPLPSSMASRSLWRYPSQPTAQPPARTFNFAQYYTSSEKYATMRNEAYKLNYDNGTWSFYEYQAGEIPGREDDGTAIDLFGSALADLQAGVTTAPSDNLAQLLGELLDSSDYQMDAQTVDWPDPR